MQTAGCEGAAAPAGSGRDGSGGSSSGSGGGGKKINHGCNGGGNGAGSGGSDLKSEAPWRKSAEAAGRRFVGSIMAGLTGMRDAAITGLNGVAVASGGSNRSTATPTSCSGATVGTAAGTD